MVFIILSVAPSCMGGLYNLSEAKFITSAACFYLLTHIISPKFIRYLKDIVYVLKHVLAPMEDSFRDSKTFTFLLKDSNCVQPLKCVATILN